MNEDFQELLAYEDFEGVDQGINENPLCPECNVEMKWAGSSTSLAKCPECREEYKARKQVRTAVKKVEK